MQIGWKILVALGVLLLIASNLFYYTIGRQMITRLWGSAGLSNNGQYGACSGSLNTTSNSTQSLQQYRCTAALVRTENSLTYTTITLNTIGYLFVVIGIVYFLFGRRKAARQRQ